MRESHCDFFRGREAVFTIKNHRVRTVEHEHRSAGRLVFALVDLQIGIFNVERQGETLALDGTGERGRYVEVERVAELIGFRRPAGLDAGRKVASVVASKAGFAERAEQVTQGFEAQEVEALVGDFKLGLRSAFADLA